MPRPERRAPPKTRAEKRAQREVDSRIVRILRHWGRLEFKQRLHNPPRKVEGKVVLYVFAEGEPV